MTEGKDIPVAITLGDPGGIGPRVIFESCRELIGSGKNFFFLIADYDKVKPIADKYHCPLEKIPENKINKRNKNALAVYDFPFENPIFSGQIDKKNANAILGMIEKAVSLILKGEAAAMVTGPINKNSVSSGLGIDFSGHTGFLSEICKCNNKVVMMMQSGDFRVVPLTEHVPLNSVFKYITKQNIISAVTTINSSLKRYWNIPKPKIFISGLNPHAGENGNIGLEEKKIIEPAISELASKGIDASGPYSADSMFNRNARSNYDVALCMYHDQALIPIKTMFFDTTINITLGLPIIRTSPGHGTAIDAVGLKNINTLPFKTSLLEAQRLAYTKGH